MGLNESDDFNVSERNASMLDAIVCAAKTGNLAVVTAKLHGESVGLLCVISEETDAEATLVPVASIIGENESFDTLEVADPRWIQDNTDVH